jgi:putative hydrolase of the HAD superfamily
MLSNLGLPSAVLLDLDNTLYDYNTAHAAGMNAVQLKLHESLGIKPNDFSRAFDNARANVKERLHGTASSHSRLLYFKDMIESLGLRTQPLLSLDLEQIYWRSFLAAAELLPGVVEFLEELRFLGIPRILITDLTTQIQFRKLVYFELDGSFDFIVTSEEVGIEKPDARIFEYAVSKLHLKEGALWMIGDDTERDMRGAKDALGCITFQRDTSHTSGVRAGVVDRSFSDFKELLALLRSASARECSPDDSVANSDSSAVKNRAA